MGKATAHRMTLEEHRIQLLKQIAGCTGAAAARDLIQEAHLMLVCFDLQPCTLRQFWVELRAELDPLQEELLYLSDHETRLLRGSVITAARVAATGLVNELDATSLGAVGNN
jgi:hypothetical protein